MPSKNNIGKDSVILTASQLFVLGINMINAMLLSRYRTLTEYGTYSQIMMVCTVVITFFSAGFSQCINFFLAGNRTDIEKEQFIKNYYSIVSLIGIIGGSVSFLLLPFLKIYFGNEALETYGFVLLIYPVAHILNSGIDRFFIVYKKTNKLLWLKTIYSVVTLFEVVFAVYFGISFYHYMCIYVIVEFINALLTYLWIKLITGTVPFGINASWIKRIIVFAIPMALASLVSTLNTEMDKLIVGGLVDTETLAIYSNAAKELPVYIFSTSISSVTMPFIVRKISDGRYKEAAHLWRSSIKLSFYIICFFVTALFVFAPQVISILYSDKYVPGTNVFRIYSLVLLFRITYYGMVLNSLGKTKQILKCSVFTMLTNLVLDIALYRIVELKGPAIATLLSVGVMNMYQLVLSKKYIGVSFTDIYPVKFMGSCILLNAVLGMFFYCINNLLIVYAGFIPNIVSVILGIVWMALYIAIIYKNFIKIWKVLNEGE